MTIPNDALPGGISSAARGLPPVDGVEFRVSRAQGACVWDTAGRRYVDYSMAMGATVIGHTHPEVMSAVAATLQSGPLPGFAHEWELAAAQALVRFTAPLSQVVFANSGSEAVHLACKIARAVTGKSRIAKFAGAYDGWFTDVAFGNAGSEAARMAGPRPVNNGTVLLRYNDLEDAEALFAEYDDIAGILAEPVLANAGCIMPAPGYLARLQSLARQHGALVIADEVLIGFKTRPGLTSHHLGWDPDLAALGKAIGSGIPVAAVAGKPDVMSALVDGRVTRAGTYSGSALASAAVCATMAIIARLDYDRLLAAGDILRADIERSFRGRNLPIATTGYGSVFSLWFAERAPASYAEAAAAGRAELSMALHLALRHAGVLFAPSPWGRFFVSAAHDAEAMAQTREAFERAADRLAPIIAAAADTPSG